MFNFWWKWGKFNGGFWFERRKVREKIEENSRGAQKNWANQKKLQKY